MRPTKLMLMTALLAATSFLAAPAVKGNASEGSRLPTGGPQTILLSQAQPAPGTSMQQGMPMPGAQGAQPGAAQPGMGGMGGMMGMMGMMGRGQGMMPPTQPGATQPGMSGMSGMEMMEMGMGQGAMPQGQSPMGQPGMQMGGPMQQGQGMGPAASYAAPIGRVEGRIAFLRAELKITDAQLAVWNSYADALRAGARRHNEMREHMAAMPANPMTASSVMELHERMLSARLESTKAARAALERLQAVLTDEQRTTLNELLPVHFRML